MNNQTIARDLNVIRKLGIEALIEKLGPIGMVEFMHQFDSGYGDYTKERHAWLDNLTIENISLEIKNINKA
ncbi:hypothetical protein AGMMS49546_39220 [Spirochaetia bacterium]|nr:hypothetical protein AGMMS49546_39220 [Spirochaetia bacterium]